MRSLVTSKLSCMLALFSRSFLQLFVVLVHVDISLFYVPRRLCVSAYARPIQARTVSKAAAFEPGAYPGLWRSLSAQSLFFTFPHHLPPVLR